MKKAKILLVEKSPIVAQGLTAILNEGTSFEVAAVADSLDRIAERLIVVKPDIVVLNPQLVDYSKRHSFRALFQESPQVPIVALLYSYFDQQWLRNFNGIIELTDDRKKIESHLTEVLQSDNTSSEGPDLYELSEREREVLIELANGLSNKEIATKLHISVHTAITHRKNIVKKTGIKSVAGLTVYAMLNNLM